MVKNVEGIVYVLLVEMEGKSLVKIGVTTRSIEERVVEILTSAFKVYREFFYCKPKRFKKTVDIYEKEAELHKAFDRYRYKPSKKFGGSSEFFDVPLDEVVVKYDAMIATSTKPKTKKPFFKANRKL